MNIINKSVGEIVVEDYRTAEIFSKYHIDFCCRGDQSIENVCRTHNISIGTLEKEIKDVLKKGMETGINYDDWPLDLLADYIEKKHHRYVETQIPKIKVYMQKIIKVHGNRHPELQNIDVLFRNSADELTMHMKREELILFPYIRKMVMTKNSLLSKPPFKTVRNPIDQMTQEHEAEGERFEKIRELSNNYTPPRDGCNTYKVTYALLKEFEDDLHLHIHLENNILFPKAITLEQKTQNINITH